MTDGTEPTAAEAQEHRCAAPGCGKTFTPRRGGRPMRFCSAVCRKTAWRDAYRQAGALIGGAPNGQTNVQTKVGVAPDVAEPKNGHAVENACRWCGERLPAIRNKIAFCGTSCQTRFWTALRWAAWEEYEAGRLSLERLKEIDARWRADAEARREQQREARRTSEEAKKRSLAHKRRQLAAARRRAKKARQALISTEGARQERERVGSGEREATDDGR